VDDVLRLVVVALDGRAFALPLAAVERVVRMVDVTPLPGAPEVVEGVIDVAGDVVAAVSIRRRLGLARGAARTADSLVLARTPRRRLAVIVDSVTGVAECPQADMVSATAIAPGAKHIEGILKSGAGLILIHDLEKFLSPEEEHSLERAMGSP
jgi:purine-binding chemotaxis protein CheW